MSETFGIRKQERFDDPIIADFIRSDKCLTCGDPPPSTVSHTARRGRTGNNASILKAIPQCMKCHRLYEDNLMEIDALTIELYGEKIAAYLCQKIREFTGEEKPAAARVKVPTKPKNDFIKRCSLLTDEQMIEAGIRIPETIRRIRQGRIGKNEERKLRLYLALPPNDFLHLNKGEGNGR